MMLKMLLLLLLSFRLLQGIPGLLVFRPSHGYLEERGSLRYGVGQPSHASLLQMVGEVPLSSDFDPLEMPGLQDGHTPEASRVEPQAPPPGPREERSPPPLSLPPPRRCVRLQESCLGHHKLPCCDPCATCYCRFFNANCFCKRISSAFACGRN